MPPPKLIKEVIKRKELKESEVKQAG